MGKDKHMEELQESREPTLIQIYYNDKSDLEEMFSMDKFKVFAYDKILKSIEHSLDENLDKVEVFTINNYDSTLTLKRDEFKSPLQVILKYYEEGEDYIKCNEIVKLINRI